MPSRASSRSRDELLARPRHRRPAGGPGVDGSHARRGRPGRRRALQRTASTSAVGLRRATRRATAARQRGEPLLRRRRGRRRSTPSPSGSGGPGSPAGSPSGRRRPRAAGTPAPGCPWTSTSSRRRSRPCRRARRPARTSVPAERRLRLGGAHLVVREHQVAAAALHVERRRRGGAARSPRTRCASRDGPGRGRSPRPARPGARPATAGSRAGPSCRAGRGRRRARRTPPASASSVRPRHLRRSAGRRARRSRGRRRRRRRAPRVLQLLDQLDDERDRLDRADVVVRRQHPQRGHVLAEQLGLALGELGPVHRRSRSARSSSGSSTSVTFCT